MKRCPECRRDYFDETLLYCLDDGSALVKGPRSTGERMTAILHETAEPSEAATIAQIHTTEAETRKDSSSVSEKSKSSSRRASKLLVLLTAASLILLLGFLSYRYFAPAKQIASIAVMPFVNDSGNADVEYISDGMTETLIKSLSQVPNLAVKSRSTVFYYKGKETSPKKIGEEPDVQAVLLGRVGGRGDDLKLNLELVIETCHKMIELDPNYHASYELLGLSYLRQGRNAEALANLEKAVEMTKRVGSSITSLGYAYGVTGKRAEAIAVVKE